MRIAICDDNVLTCETLRDEIERHYRSLDILIDLFSSGEKLLERIGEGTVRYEILLLDIEMDGIGGMETAKALHDAHVQTRIIFVTSHEEFARKGYEVAAFRYLVKPVHTQELISAVEAARQEVLGEKRILLQKDGETQVLYSGEITYVEAMNQEMAYHTAKETLLQRERIEHCEALLAGCDFYRIHRSYLVNMHHIKSTAKREVLLSTQERLPVSRLREKQFLAAFSDFILRSVH